jgi:hypothetical protein
MYYLLRDLPDDLIDHIYKFLPFNIKATLSKKMYIDYYEEYYEYIKNIICKGIYRRFTFNTYIEKIIKNDAVFLFEKIIKKEICIWGKKKKYKYKGKKYKNYIDFLKELCQKNESTKCLNLIKYFTR